VKNVIVANRHAWRHGELHGSVPILEVQNGAIEPFAEERGIVLFRILG
jgi:hypothetical protein